jgi:hypothetical protein
MLTLPDRDTIVFYLMAYVLAPLPYVLAFWWVTGSYKVILPVLAVYDLLMFFLSNFMRNVRN